MSNPARIPDPTVFAAWTDLAGDLVDWHDALRRIAEYVWTGSDDPAFLLLADKIETLGPVRSPLVDELQDLSMSAILNALGTGAVLGFALCRTQPERFEDFGDWIRRAGELAAPAVTRTRQPEPPDAA